MSTKRTLSEHINQKKQIQQMFILYFTVNPFFHISTEHSMHPYCSLPFSNMFCGRVCTTTRYAKTPRTSRKHPPKIRKIFPLFYSFLII